MEVCNGCGANTLSGDQYCEDCNDSLANEIDAALKSCPSLPDGWTAEAFNMGNVNIDIKIMGGQAKPWFFRYCGIYRVRKDIDQIGIDKYAAQFVASAVTQDKQQDIFYRPPD